MSEKSLEDFFAKKDKSKKSKSKGKTKFTTTDEIAKKLHEGEKKVLKKEKKKEEKKVEKPTTDTVEDQPKTTTYKIASAEEWNEFEDSVDKDYSGLKVQSLQISAETEEPVEEEEESEEIDENGDIVKTTKGSAQSGPWNKSSGTAQPKASPSETVRPPPEVKKPEPPKPTVNTIGGKYVPPSRRAAAAGMGGERKSTPDRRRGPKHVPQIQSDLEFPSLAASSDLAKYSDKNSDKNFQEVRKGGQAENNPAGNRPRLELENRYAALGN